MSIANMTSRGDLAVSVDEAARLLGVSSDLAYDLVRRGELPPSGWVGGSTRDRKSL